MSTTDGLLADLKTQHRLVEWAVIEAIVEAHTRFGAGREQGIRMAALWDRRIEIIEPGDQ